MSNNGVPHMPMSRQVVYPPRPFSPTPMHTKECCTSSIHTNDVSYGSCVLINNNKDLTINARPQEQKREQGPSTNVQKNSSSSVSINEDTKKFNSEFSVDEIRSES